MKTIMPLIWILFLWNNPTQEEKIVFNIIHSDKIIGEMKASKLSLEGRQIYSNTTQINTRIIKKLELTYNTRVVYKDNVLEEAEVRTLLNGKLHSLMQTKRKGKVYYFFKNGKVRNTVENPITYSSIKLLFEEPAGIPSAYSEEGGSHFSIVAVGNTTFRKINSKGQANIYQYRHKKLQSIVINTGLLDLKMVVKTSLSI